MIKANSPICASEKPDWMATLTVCPDNSTPKVAKSICPTMTTSVSIRIGILYSQSNTGSISMPTETKKMAPNKSFTGFTICSICSASIVSARIDPITKAPSAEENPALVAIMTIPRHRPILTISRVSSLRKVRALFRKEGIR